ncbi:MAG: hypothetical protein PHI28_08365 [Mangrovibacterium sp.]|nr:hypothetical protein [Mangrovibacterium sp.]
MENEFPPFIHDLRRVYEKSGLNLDANQANYSGQHIKKTSLKTDRSKRLFVDLRLKQIIRKYGYSVWENVVGRTLAAFTGKRGL